jgi:putative Mg2+ transporter-C (MgtC) family protein
MFGISELDLEMTLRVALALALGAVPGWDRENHQLPAGLRTHMLVSAGATCFTLASIYGFNSGDPARIAAQIVTGVGFLGAGTIWRGETSMKGLTTAASIWMVAAVGLLVGLGMYWLAISSSLLLFATLRLGKLVERFQGDDTSSGHKEVQGGPRPERTHSHKGEDMLDKARS